MELCSASGCDFDIHRDAAPRDVYAAKIDVGERKSQIVGRQNPSAVRRFAYDMKSLAAISIPGW